MLHVTSPFVQAAAVMAETILFNFAKLVADKLSSVIVEEVKLAWGVDEELGKIKRNLSSIQAVLQDAEKQQATSQSVRNWLGNLQDVMYDIDDLLDEIVTEVAIQDKDKGHLAKQVRKFFSGRNFLLLHQQWAHQIKNLCKKLDQIAAERRDFVFSCLSVDSSESGSRETHSLIKKSEIIGRDEDKEVVINSILSCGDSKSLSVLPIVGLGGIGKTEFAKLIYNDDRIDKNFDKKLWVYVSEKFNIKKILNQVLGMVTGESFLQLTNEQLSFEQLRIKISDALKDTKYFLILDDLWNEDSNEWRSLREILDAGAKGSTVVATTRGLNVASMVKSVDKYTLKELSDESCLLIFKNLAFKNAEEIEPMLLNLAKKIVEKSKGLPFLVTTLGNLLHGETDEREWHLVIQKLERGYEDILNILKLSYDQLPSYLKLCFRICSIFAKGAASFPIQLTYLWMALGFLPNNDQGEAPEYIARKCIDELLSKSLLQKDGPTDFLYECHMHDFVYDLAKSLVQDELAIMSDNTKEVHEKIRYIILDEDALLKKQCHDRLSKANKARLLIVYSSIHPLSKALLKSIISTLKCLRVLDLGSCQFEKLPRTIGYMKHLRYLSLQHNLKIRQLPNSICNLLNLQTLLLAGCSNLQELPPGIGRLEKLRGLSVTTQQEVLPDSIGLLNALRTLYLEACPRLVFLPLSTKQFLETLQIVDCEKLDLAHGSCSLQGLNSLQHLAIVGLPKFQKLPMSAMGLPFTSLKTLAIGECEGLNELAGWIENFTSLRQLVIGQCPNVVQLPHKFSNLRKLERLYIHDCPKLSERCEPRRGNDWHLISSIPYIYIDGEEIVRDDLQCS